MTPQVFYFLIFVLLFSGCSTVMAQAKTAKKPSATTTHTAVHRDNSTNPAQRHKNFYQQNIK
jgi:uncharacterized protein YceK